jgi:uncharacterized protein (DUF697 family)
VFVFGPWLPKGVTGFFIAQTVAVIGFIVVAPSQKGTTFALHIAICDYLCRTVKPI